MHNVTVNVTKKRKKQRKEIYIYIINIYMLNFA